MLAQIMLLEHVGQLAALNFLLRALGPEADAAQLSLDGLMAHLHSLSRPVTPIFHVHTQGQQCVGYKGDGGIRVSCDQIIPLPTPFHLKRIAEDSTWRPRTHCAGCNSQRHERVRLAKVAAAAQAAATLVPAVDIILPKPVESDKVPHVPTSPVVAGPTLPGETQRMSPSNDDLSHNTSLPKCILFGNIQLHLHHF